MSAVEKRLRGFCVSHLIFTGILILAGLLGSLAAPVFAASLTVNTINDLSDGDTSSVANLIANPGADG